MASHSAAPQYVHHGQAGVCCFQLLPWTRPVWRHLDGPPGSGTLLEQSQSGCVPHEWLLASLVWLYKASRVSTDASVAHVSDLDMDFSGYRYCSPASQAAVAGLIECSVGFSSHVSTPPSLLVGCETAMEGSGSEPSRAMLRRSRVDRLILLHGLMLCRGRRSEFMLP